MSVKINKTLSVDKKQNLVVTGSSPSGGRLYRWMGFKDLSDARNAYRESDLRAAAKSAALGTLKLGTVAAALYGVYKWTFGEPVHPHLFFSQAKQDFASQGHLSAIPRSAKDLIDYFYSEHKTFEKWPKSGKDFFSDHLSQDAPMSGAIVQHLAEEADKRGDSTFKRMVFKICPKADSSSKSCLAVLESYAGTANPDALTHAMSLLSKCRKSENAFCLKTLEKAQALSLGQRSIGDLLNVSRSMARRKNIDPGQARVFVEKVLPLSEKQLDDLEQAIEACHQASQGKEARKQECLEQRNFFERLETIDGNSWQLDRYFEKKWKNLKETVKSDAVSHAADLSLLCDRVLHSPDCDRYVKKMFERLIDLGEAKAAMRILMKAKGAVVNEVPSILNGLIQKGKWNEGIRFLLDFTEKNPSIDIRASFDSFWRKLLQSSERHLATGFLKMKQPILIEETLKAAFTHIEEEHLHQAFLAAKSWIASKDPQYKPHLVFLIEQLFKQQRGYYSDFYGDMARILATQWLHAIDPSRIDRATLEHPSWRITDREGSRFDRYSNAITSSNWKRQLGI